MEVEVEQTGGLPSSPEEGGGATGNDVGGGTMPQKIRGVTPRELDFVGPAIATTSGADDKDRPDIGDRPEGDAASPNDDLGNDLPGDRTVGTGGEAANPFRELFYKMLGIDPDIVY
ncbi:MAG: hypothetical protein A2W31_09860 [Planctomycetes bacterium RBG_16_64_10]|nr:MAG: hypothetical protein A2W31_09860 [Planctomycetes bacterium RBG_16_64_10]